MATSEESRWLEIHRNHEDTKTTKGHEEDPDSQDLPVDAVLQHRDIEIHEQADARMRHAHVVQQLRMVDRRKLLHRLDFERTMLFAMTKSNQ